MDTSTQESSGSSTRPRRQLLTSRQAQDLLSTLLDGEKCDERPLIPAKRSKPSTTKGTNRPRSTATEPVVTGGQTPSVLQKISHRLVKIPSICK